MTPNSKLKRKIRRKAVNKEIKKFTELARYLHDPMVMSIMDKELERNLIQDMLQIWVDVCEMYDIEIQSLKWNLDILLKEDKK